ncbi:MAG: uncharacterized protein H6Q89_3326 [Myxococcaceae bacterium]|nr:uncharacterized protein [Myxococcaceae bacterium]
MKTTANPVTASAVPPAPDVVLRPLRAEDLEAVVALDRRSVGPSRRGYFEKRLQAALRQPKRHLQFALTTPKGLVGFLQARIAGGEYGRPKESVILEAVGVDPAARHAGLGQRMMAGLEELMRSRGIEHLLTQVDWRNHAMLKFLDAARFELAPRHLLERKVDRIPLPSDDAEIEKWPPVVRHLQAGDFDAIVRIDSRVTGKARSEYFKRKFDEVLNESAIAVSLVAESDGFPVAFAMARVDSGDFGHVEPVAALDTIGVDPGFARKGYARAVLEQMVENLAALHVERLETEISNDAVELQKFLVRFGFGPSQRLSFQRVL